MALNAKPTKNAQHNKFEKRAAYNKAKGGASKSRPVAIPAACGK